MASGRIMEMPRPWWPVGHQAIAKKRFTYHTPPPAQTAITHRLLAHWTGIAFSSHVDFAWLVQRRIEHGSFELNARRGVLRHVQQPRHAIHAAVLRILSGFVVSGMDVAVFTSAPPK